MLAYFLRWIDGYIYLDIYICSLTSNNSGVHLFIACVGCLLSSTTRILRRVEMYCFYNFQLLCLRLLHINIKACYGFGFRILLQLRCFDYIQRRCLRSQHHHSEMVLYTPRVMYLLNYIGNKNEFSKYAYLSRIVV